MGRALIKTEKDYLILDCECGSHKLDLEVLNDYDDDSWIVSMMFFARVGKGRFWHSIGRRIKMAFELLRYGEACTSDIILSKKDCTEFIKFMRRCIKNNSPKNEDIVFPPNQSLKEGEFSKEERK